MELVKEGALGAKKKQMAFDSLARQLISSIAGKKGVILKGEDKNQEGRVSPSIHNRVKGKL